MKANPRVQSLGQTHHRPAVLQGLWGCAALMALASCTATPAPPPVAHTAPPPPRIAPPPPRMAEPADWRDAAISEGHWRLVVEGPRSTAHFGGFTLACRKDGAVDLGIGGPPTSANPMLTITTSSGRTDRQGYGSAFHIGMAGLVLSARDRLLDAIAFSRGRFMVEIEGRARMILPADPAVSRVIEDCRR